MHWPDRDPQAGWQINHVSEQDRHVGEWGIHRSCMTGWQGRIYNEFEGVRTNPPSLDTSSLEVLQNIIIQVHKVKVAAGVAECGLWHMRVEEPPFPNSRFAPAYMRQPPVFFGITPTPEH